MGNKNVVIGLVVILLFLTMSVHIERTASQHAFQSTAVAAVVLYPIRDVYFFWGRWMSPAFSGGWVSQVVYPLKNLGGAAMGLALLLALVVFLQGAKRASAPAKP